MKRRTFELGRYYRIFNGSEGLGVMKGSHQGLWSIRAGLMSVMVRINRLLEEACADQNTEIDLQCVIGFSLKDFSCC